jgi:hypothetical protein
MLGVKCLQALPVPDEPIICAMHKVHVLLQVCFADRWILCWVQGRGLRCLRRIMAQSPEAPARLMRRAGIIDYGSQRLPHSVHTAVDIIVQHPSTLDSSAQR